MKQVKKGNTNHVEFRSISEFFQYISTAETNGAFENQSLSSHEGDESFTHTKSFDEAVTILKNGWTDMSTKLTQRLNKAPGMAVQTMASRNVIAVAGYQPIVPLYLNGSPVNMVSRKQVPIKQKVVTLNKSISYSGSTSVQTIIEESVKALQIVKKLEAQGLRVNLNVIIGMTAGSVGHVVKVRIKNSTEKLNVSKLAFPLVHPSMLRRLFFRFIEVHPTITSSYVHGYGAPIGEEDLRKYGQENGEYLIPKTISADINTLKSVNDIR